MDLPCIKFITFTASYITLMVLLVLSSLRVENKDLDEGSFKDLYNHTYESYQIYIKRNLTYKFQTENFFIRNTRPNNIDLTICVWLLGSTLKLPT